MAEKETVRGGKYIERLLGITALFVLAAAWIIGSSRNREDLTPHLKQALPEADRFSPISEGTYAAWKDTPHPYTIGTLATGRAQGYGGEIRVVVSIDATGKITGISLIEHKETGAFLQRVLKKGFIDSLLGKSCADNFQAGQGIDAVTGATYTSNALAEAVCQAARKTASKNLGMEFPAQPAGKIVFGLPEIVLLFLFSFGIIGRCKRCAFKKAARWISMLTGLVFLGFIFSKPLNLVIINRFLLGLWLPWREHIYWYVLLAGILLFITAGKQNPYCGWFCPFGAAQECLSLIGGTRVRPSNHIRVIGRWFQRFAALAAIVIALLYRNPGMSSYEVFGAFFQLIGSNFQFGLLGIVLVAALFIRRPWCGYLCPMRPVTDFLRMMHNWAGDIYTKIRPARPHPSNRE